MKNGIMRLLFGSIVVLGTGCPPWGGCETPEEVPVYPLEDAVMTATTDDLSAELLPELGAPSGTELEGTLTLEEDSYVLRWTNDEGQAVELTFAVGERVEFESF